MKRGTPLKAFWAASILWVGATLLLSSCGQSPPPKIREGRLDLRSHNFATQPTLRLTGTVEFAWDTLLPPTATRTSFPTLATIPQAWNGNLTELGTRVGSAGRATYHWTILTDGKTSLALETRTLREAYTLYINGQTVAQQGRVQPPVVQVDVQPRLISLPQTDTLEVVLHMANLTAYKGGLVEAFTLGEKTTLQRTRYLNRALEAFLIGALLLIGLYHLMLSFSVPQSRRVLYFGIICLLLALRTGNTGEHLMVEWMPWVPRWLSSRFEFGSVYLTPLALIMFLRHSYPSVVPKLLFRIMVGISLFLATTIVLPWDIPFSFVLPLFQAQLVLVLPVFVIVLFSRATRKGLSGARLMSWGLIAFFLTAINDLLYLNYVIDTGFFASYGLLALIITQATVMAKSLTLTYRQVELLSSNLEKSVNERTQELARKSQELSDQQLLIQDQDNSLEKNLRYAQRVMRSIYREGVTLTDLFPGVYGVRYPFEEESPFLVWTEKNQERTFLVALEVAYAHLPGTMYAFLVYHLLYQLLHTSEYTTPKAIIAALNKKLQQALDHPSAQPIPPLSMGMLVLEDSQATLFTTGPQFIHVPGSANTQPTPTLTLESETSYTVPAMPGDWWYVYGNQAANAAIWENEAALQDLAKLTQDEQREQVGRWLQALSYETYALWIGVQS